MKRIILILIVIFLTIKGNSQSNGSGDKQSTNSASEHNQEIDNDFNELKTKYEINESIEEVKQKIKDLDEKNKILYKFKNSLESYKAQLNSYNLQSYIETISKIDSYISAKDNVSIQSQQSLLAEKINYLYYNDITIFTDRTIADNSIVNFRNFRKVINEILKPLDTGAIFEIQEYSSNTPILADKKKLSEIKLFIENFLPGILEKLQKSVDAEILSNNSRIEETKREIKNEKTKKNKLFDKLAQEETQINGLSIKLGLPLFCGTIIILFLGPKIIQSRRKNR